MKWYNELNQTKKLNDSNSRKRKRAEKSDLSKSKNNEFECAKPHPKIRKLKG